jgi:SHS2 domain-containing protein
LYLSKYKVKIHSNKQENKLCVKAISKSTLKTEQTRSGSEAKVIFALVEDRD